MLVWAVVASAAYWLVLLLRLPGWTWYPVCATFSISAWVFLRPRKLHGRITQHSRWTGLLLLICLASGAVSAFTNRPDSDDIAFSHRAVQAASALDKPLALGDTALDVGGLPPLTPLHVFTSVEVTTALMARALHFPQVLAIHQGLGTLVNLMVPLVYFLLLRFFRVPMSAAVIGTAAVLAMFLVSGNSHRDWGNFSLLRSWQGKCILVALMVPLGVLFSLRYVQFGRRRDLLRLHAVNLAAIGLSGTGLFLLPFVIGVAGAGAWLAAGASRTCGARMCRLASTLIFPVLVAVLPWIGVLPKVGDISFYQIGGWPTDYLDNLSLVFDGRSLILDVALLGTAVLLGRRNVQIYGLLAYSFLSVLLLTAPGPRDILMDIVTPGAYWRLGYVFIVPLWAGLAAAALYRPAITSWRRHGMAGAVICALIAGTIWAKIPALNRAVLATPGLKFPPADLVDARELAATMAPGVVVLADYRVVTILGLLRPDVRFIVTRPVDTEINFSNGGRNKEGALRLALGTALVKCDFSKVQGIDVAEMWPNLRAVIVPVSCAPGPIRHALGLTQIWQETALTSYRVWTR